MENWSPIFHSHPELIIPSHLRSKCPSDFVSEVHGFHVSSVHHGKLNISICNADIRYDVGIDESSSNQFSSLFSLMEKVSEKLYFFDDVFILQSISHVGTGIFRLNEQFLFT
jgi:hypothetical protein